MYRCVVYLHRIKYKIYAHVHVKLLKIINTFFDDDFIGNYVWIQFLVSEKNVKMHGG